MFNVIICGSRDYDNYERLKSMCDYYLSRKIQGGEKVVIISGGAKGADSLGERYAKERGLEVRVFKADWDKYGKRAGILRNTRMAEISNACIAFPSAYSENKGTTRILEKIKNVNLCQSTCI